MAHSSRTWTGARTPQALKRVRQSAARRVVLQPRRSAAKTYVAKALASAGNGDADQTREAMLAAISALDRAAKVGAIHPNAADRRKSRLVRALNTALAAEGGGTGAVAGGKAKRQTGKTAAGKAAKTRIAAGKATKAKGEQTAAGKARAALRRSTREATSATSVETATETATPASTETPATPARRTRSTRSSAASSAPTDADTAATPKPTSRRRSTPAS